MIINGAWYIDALPNQIVIELENGDLKMFFLTPFRELELDDLLQYKGYHPRKCKGQPLPYYLYRFYGLQKNDESLSEVVRFRLRPSEKQKLNTASKNAGKTESEFLRDFVGGL